jgi:hypothetical protein
MSGLRIMFEVDEKHVGACLVALEGRARNLNFEVIQEADWQKNRPSGRGPGKIGKVSPAAWAAAGFGPGGAKIKLTPEFVLERLKDTSPPGMDKETLGALVKQAGFKVQGLNSIMLSLVGKKLVKKVGKAYVLAAAAKGAS